MARIEQEYDLLELQASLESVKKAIRDTCDDLELDALIDVVETKELYRPHYRNDREGWHSGLGTYSPPFSTRNPEKPFFLPWLYSLDQFTYLLSYE